MRTLALVAAILIAGSSQIAQAVTVRVDFSGTVYGVFGSGDVGDPIAAIGGSIEPGTPFSGYLRFDDTIRTPGISELNPRIATYRFAPGEGEFHSEVGDFVFDARFASPNLREWLFSMRLEDYYEIYGEVQVGWGGWIADLPAGAELLPISHNVGLYGLWGSSGPLPSLELSGIPWSLEWFNQAAAFWDFQNGSFDRVSVEGTIESLSVTAPEPSPGALGAAMLFGLVALGFRRARD